MAKMVSALGKNGGAVAQWLAHWPLVLEVPGLIPALMARKIWCPNLLPFIPFARMI